MREGAPEPVVEDVATGELRRLVGLADVGAQIERWLTEGETDEKA